MIKKFYKLFRLIVNMYEECINFDEDIQTHYCVFKWVE